MGASALAAGTASNNNTTAFGYNALLVATGGSNLAVGSNALVANTTGDDNTAVGSYAPLAANTTGTKNVAVGRQALNSNTTASNNTAVGYQAGLASTTAGNTYIGYIAGYTNVSGANNTYIGSQAGANNTGGTNTYIGYACGSAVTAGANNTFIGGYNGNQSSGNVTLDLRTASNRIVISDGGGSPRIYVDDGGGMFTYTPAAGYNTYSQYHTGASNPYGQFIYFSQTAPNNTANYFLRCGDNSANRLFIYSNGTVQNATGTYTTISDAKLKENVVDATPKLENLAKLRVVNYNLIGDELKQIGFIAQEIEQVFPNLVFETTDLDEKNQPTGETTKGVKLTVMIPMLVKAMQELKAIVDAQAAEIAELKAKVGA